MVMNPTMDSHHSFCFLIAAKINALDTPRTAIVTGKHWNMNHKAITVLLLRNPGSSG
jgi:hypothetical protein